MKALKRSQKMLGHIVATLGMGPHEDLEDFALKRRAGGWHVHSFPAAGPPTSGPPCSGMTGHWCTDTLLHLIEPGDR